MVTFCNFIGISLISQSWKVFAHMNCDQSFVYEMLLVGLDGHRYGKKYFLGFGLCKLSVTLILWSRVFTTPAHAVINSGNRIFVATFAKHTFLKKVIL